MMAKNSIHFLVASVIFSTALPALADPIEVLVHERKPYYVTAGPKSIGGIVGKPAADAFAASGVDYEWRVTSANAQLNIIKANRRRVCAVGWFKSAEREAFAKFAMPIYEGKLLVVVSQADSQSVLGHDTLDALLGDRDLKMGRKLGYSYGKYIDAKMAALNPRMVTTSQDNDGMIGMLLSRRFDYMFATAEESAMVIEGVGTAAADLLTMTMKDTPPGNKRYILCSRSVEDAVIDKLNAAIAKGGGG